MNFVFLSPHFPENFFHFPAELKKLGVHVLGIADTPYEHLRPEVRESLTDYYRVDDLNDYGQLLRALGYFTYRYGKLHGIDSLNEHWLETEARLRTDFNMEGTHTDTIRDIKDKSRMKKIFVQAGVPVARGRVVGSPKEAHQWIAEIGYPLVAKPDSGVGAASTYKITNHEELEAFFAAKAPIDYLMEEYIDGEIFSFDGLVDREGRLLFYTSHQYGGGVMEAVNEDRHVYYTSLREIPQDLEEAGLAVLRAFQVRGKFFHFEFFRTRREGRIVALEVNMRPPGGWSTDMFNYAADIDVYREWARMIVGLPGSAPYERKYHVAYVGRKFNKTYRHSHEAILDRYGALICHHAPLSGLFTAAMGNYGYLVRSPKREIVQEAVDFIHALVEPHQ